MKRNYRHKQYFYVMRRKESNTRETQLSRWRFFEERKIAARNWKEALLRYLTPLDLEHGIDPDLFIAKKPKGKTYEYNEPRSIANLVAANRKFFVTWMLDKNEQGNYINPILRYNKFLKQSHSAYAREYRRLNYEKTSALAQEKYRYKKYNEGLISLGCDSLPKWGNRDKRWWAKLYEKLAQERDERLNNRWKKDELLINKLKKRPYPTAEDNGELDD